MTVMQRQDRLAKDLPNDVLRHEDTIQQRKKDRERYG
jgi:hypothetical protein